MDADGLAEIVVSLRRIGRDDAGLEVKLAATDKLPSETMQTLCAFANTPGGGILILGLDEARGFAAAGCEHAAKLAADLAGLCRDGLVPPLMPLISLPEFEDQTLVVAEVPELDPADKPCYLRGKGQPNGSYIRISDGDHRLTSYEVSQLLINRGQPIFDMEPVEEAGGVDLHDELVADYLRDLRRSRPALARRDDEDLLRRCGVLVRSALDDQRLVPSLGGLLALGRDPQSFDSLRGCAITVTAYPTPRKGETGPDGQRFLDDKILEGPAPILLAEVFDVLYARMSRSGIVEGIGREDHWEYPLEALREILVNAVAHRDYSPMSRGTRIHVEMYPDRLEVVSPGGLFGPVTIDRLGDESIASARNRVLVDILENVRFHRDRRALCEGRATGIPTVLNSLRQAGLVPPRFKDNISDFRVIVPNRALLDESTRAWLYSLGQPSISPTQEMALAVLRTGRALTSDEYRIELAVDSKVARRELGDLVQRGLVRTVNQRRWARYVLDDAAEDPHPTLFSELLGHEPRHQRARAARDRETRGSATRRQRVLELLAVESPLTRAEIAVRLSLGDRQVSYELTKMITEGLVARTTEAYSDPNAAYRLTRPPA
ncbi:ATP-binding protein [Pseudofrankia sp. DC12]|uniref:ATP-binding protein n=1 Tax=Pseudofrankia sp. DC12 TaxID=683315 RepID=UPI0005F7F0DD|nr:ATP-binding protein [Pseudofrankia sp. DC12]